MKIPPITPLQWRDTAMALTFLLLLIGYFTHSPLWQYAAMGLLLLAMIYPRAMAPLARGWFGFSALLGHVVSTILLGIVYIGLVLPVGAVRRVLGKDAMRRKLWKQGHGSVFVLRGTTYSKDDILQPY